MSDGIYGRDLVIDQLRAVIASQNNELEIAKTNEAMLRESLNSIKWHRKPGGSPNKYEYEIEILAMGALTKSSDDWIKRHDAEIIKKAKLEERKECSEIYVPPLESGGTRFIDTYRELIRMRMP